ncbi:ORFL194C [Human betaherpesvirus 5]|nr:ORFL194C [Human betaherpesvirus 5]QHX40539.1 ORFL194C [Human betaherpesvirus 5]
MLNNAAFVEKPHQHVTIKSARVIVTTTA